jgi:hypothetical protein
MPDNAPATDAAATTTDAPVTEAQDKTFTQADLDRVVEERLARAGKKFADYDDVKAKAARLDELEAASASDLDKAVAAARKEVETELTAAHRAERIADKIAVAAAGRFADPEDAPRYLSDAETAAKFVNSDGAIDTAAITAAIDSLLEAKPHLKASTETPKPPPPSAVGLGVTGDTAPVSAPGTARMASAYAASAK